MVEVVIGGVQKCGTSALHKYLKRHPQIVAGIKKELHFFDDPTLDWGNPDYAPYEAMFPKRRKKRLRLDASPSYIYLPQSLERLKAYSPDARLIFIFRDPLERAWSHWSMTTRKGAETLGFDEAISAERDRLASHAAGGTGGKVFAYVDRGHYGRQLAQALDVFPREQMLCLSSDALRADPDAVLVRVADHLGIAPFAQARPVGTKKVPGPPMTMLQTTRRFIRDTLQEDIRRFSDLSGVATQHWKIFQETN